MTDTKNVPEANVPSNEFTHLWNDMPQEERLRLMPHMIESQILHLWQAKEAAIKAHKAHMAHLDSWIGNLNQSLKSMTRDNSKGAVAEQIYDKGQV